MCRAICLAESTSARPSLVLLLLDRLEDFRKGLFFGVTEILLLVLGIYGDGRHLPRLGRANTAPSAFRFRQK
jgi:hypothetical protein